MRKNVWRIDDRGSNALRGVVVWAPGKSIWNTAMSALAIALAPRYFSWERVLVVPGSELHHSAARSLSGDASSLDSQDIRLSEALGAIPRLARSIGRNGRSFWHFAESTTYEDWAQRQPQCHDFFAHRRGLLIDSFWQLHCTFQFEHGPRFLVEPEFHDDPWYRLMEWTWPIHQLVVAVVLYLLGGFRLGSSGACSCGLL